MKYTGKGRCRCMNARTGKEAEDETMARILDVKGRKSVSVGGGRFFTGAYLQSA